MENNQRPKLTSRVWKKAVTISLLAMCAFGGIWAFKSNLFTPTVAINHVTTEGWIRYISPDNKFNVDFPKLPEEIKMDLPVPSQGKVLKYHEYKSSVDEKVSYSVSHVDLPKKWTLLSTKTILKTALDILNQNEPGAQLISNDFTSHGSHTVLDFHSKKMNGDTALETKGRLLLIGTSLYKLAVTYVPTTEQAPDAQHSLFLSSFAQK
jgi:predicted YcjX-like family ATPase